MSLAQVDFPVKMDIRILLDQRNHILVGRICLIGVVNAFQVGAKLDDSPQLINGHSGVLGFQVKILHIIGEGDFSPGCRKMKNGVFRHRVLDFQQIRRLELVLFQGQLSRLIGVYIFDGGFD